MIWYFIIAGLLLASFCGYGIWWLVSFFLKGILTANWLMVVGGGILMYLFIILLLVGFVAGAITFVLGVLED